MALLATEPSPVTLNPDPQLPEYMDNAGSLPDLDRGHEARRRYSPLKWPKNVREWKLEVGRTELAPISDSVETGSTAAWVADTVAPAKDLDQTTELIRQFMEFLVKSYPARVDLQSYQERIEVLRSDAAEDGFSLNIASERDFFYFIKSMPFICKGSLVLMDNGNLRAVWKGNDDSHLGLQFLGKREAQFVIFKRRTRAAQISRTAGRDTFEGIRKLIKAFDLQVFL